VLVTAGWFVADIAVHGQDGAYLAQSPGKHLIIVDLMLCCATE